MKITETSLSGIFEIESKRFIDERGVFVKTFHDELFSDSGLDVDFKETFYSTSKRNVIRGMHFQTPPHDHSKLVYVCNGSILDVVVDIRKNSPTFGEFYKTYLSEENAKSLYISKGFAHGFLVISDSATVIYQTTTVYSPESDSGILWNSFGYDWEGVESPVLSERDKLHPKL